MARDFRHHFLSALVRSVVLWTWWIPAWGFAWWVLRRAGGKDDKEAKGIGRRLTAVVAGAVLGVLASASLVCFFLAVETVPHALWAMTLGRNIMFHFVLLWLPVALLGWALVGAFVGFMLAILRPIREVLYPPLPRLLGRLLRLCRLDQAAAYLSLPV